MNLDSEVWFPFEIHGKLFVLFRLTTPTSVEILSDDGEHFLWSDSKDALYQKLSTLTTMNNIVCDSSHPWYHDMLKALPYRPPRRSISLPSDVIKYDPVQNSIVRKLDASTLSVDLDGSKLSAKGVCVIPLSDTSVVYIAVDDGVLRSWSIDLLNGSIRDLYEWSEETPINPDWVSFNDILGCVTVDSPTGGHYRCRDPKLHPQAWEKLDPNGFWSHT